MATTFAQRLVDLLQVVSASRCAAFELAYRIAENRDAGAAPQRISIAHVHVRVAKSWWCLAIRKQPPKSDWHFVQIRAARLVRAKKRTESLDAALDNVRFRSRKPLHRTARYYFSFPKKEFTSFVGTAAQFAEKAGIGKGVSLCGMRLRMNGVPESVIVDEYPDKSIDVSAFSKVPVDWNAEPDVETFRTIEQVVLSMVVKQ